MNDQPVLSDEGFLVQQPAFQGSLGKLAYALRSGQVSPQQIDVLALVRTYLTYFNQYAQDNLDAASDALPLVARVIELKVRLLLPRPPRLAEDAEETELETTLEAITLLEDLEHAIDFLCRRREARRIILPARTPPPIYPREARPLKIKLDTLKDLASRYRFDSYFELARERLTMAGAIKQLMHRLKQLRRGTLLDLVEHKSWEVVSVTFAGMLELFKEGRIDAYQAEPYDDIELEVRQAQRKAA
jgi:segregation and condensation protein A